MIIIVLVIINDDKLSDNAGSQDNSSNKSNNDTNSDFTSGYGHLDEKISEQVENI